MPAQVLIVLTQSGFAEKVASLLPGLDVVCLTDSMSALALLERATSIRVMVTCADFGPGQPNGIALARMARMKAPGIRVLFVGEESLRRFVQGLGTLMLSPVTTTQVAEAVADMLDPPSSPAA